MDPRSLTALAIMVVVAAALPVVLRRRERQWARALVRARATMVGRFPVHLARATIVEGEPRTPGWLATTPETIAFFSIDPDVAPLLIPRGAVVRVDLVAAPTDVVKLRFATLLERTEVREIWSRADIRPLLGWVAPDEDPVPGTVELPRATVIRRDDT